MENLRPLDRLNSSKNKKVLLELKDKRQLSGTLISFDIHINTVLEDVEERIDGKVTRKLGNVFIRGDMIILISPEES